ncbi:hypothetical protein [Bacteroides ovatus]|uniref:hypothetical protein n=1 Tax=Bacteroides ovatus TaxID=28116 RepID=UPI0020A7B8D9|nr:hypothetical protein [Bacteroides ovatus]CAG9926734.1 hypothetical protein BOVAC16_4438 [Bacteroides ovatus]
MKATCILVKKTDLEILIESGDKTAINKVIEQKEKALEEAENNAEWYASLGLDGMADDEVARQEKLIRDLKKLKATI